MKTTSAPLLAFMRSGQEFTLADLYTLSLPDGTVLRYTDFDADLFSGGYTFYSSGPVFKRGKARVVIGLEVDTLDVEIYPKATDLVDGLPMLAAAVAGSFDGSSLKLERAYIYPGTTVVGTINMFTGQFADLEVSRGGIKLRVNSDVADLNINMPRNLYQAACTHTLYDSGCTVNRAGAAAGSSISAGTSASYIACSLAYPIEWFNRGYIVFQTGNLTGVRRTVKGYSPGNVYLFNPLPAVPAIGDTFLAYPGCDKDISTCRAKFGNQANFKGFPFIPSPETII